MLKYAPIIGLGVVWFCGLLALYIVKLCPVLSKQPNIVVVAITVIFIIIDISGVMCCYWLNDNKFKAVRWFKHLIK